MAQELIGRIEGLVPWIPVRLPARELEAILDTGFEGALMLPAADYEALPSGADVAVAIVTATGEEEACAARQVRLEWFGRERDVLVLRSDGPIPLAGMELLRDVELVMRAREGLVRLRAIPPE